MVPEAKKNLGALSFISIQAASSNGPVLAGQDPIVLVDLESNKKLLAPAKKAVIDFLSMITDPQEANSLLSSIGNSAFTVRLKSQATLQDREELVKRGMHLLNQYKRDMDKCFQKWNSTLNDKTLPKAFKADDVFNSRQLLKNDVKKYHELIERIFELKKQELLITNT
ncbi:hypothetical protein Ciccas_004426 [Cichlidogyrus casuarinus]|uniref:Ribosome-recycling factor, mitochondrial n=1 Tax=Cichlidogyrus casuarinus TaxID=1844966 RepID=A0ABD2QCE0_9PLAT